MSSVAREIQRVEGGSIEGARRTREAIAADRRLLRIESSLLRNAGRRERRAMGPIDTMDYDALAVIRASFVEQPQISDNAPIQAIVYELAADQQISSGPKLGDRVRSVVKYARVMLSLPF